MLSWNMEGHDDEISKEGGKGGGWEQDADMPNPQAT